jgi:hypothetical protein
MGSQMFYRCRLCVGTAAILDGVAFIRTEYKASVLPISSRDYRFTWPEQKGKN